MRAEDILVDAALGTVEAVGTSACQQLITHFLRLCGEALVAEIRPDDEASLLAPVVFQRGGRQLPGGILVLRDRAVFVWVTGAIRVRTERAVVAFATVSSATVNAPAVLLQARERWSFTLPDVYAGYPIATLLAALLSGEAVAVNAASERLARARQRAVALLT